MHIPARAGGCKPGLVGAHTRALEAACIRVPVVACTQDRAVVFILDLAVVCTAAPVVVFTQAQVEAYIRALAGVSIPVLVVACTRALATPI